MPVAKLCTSVTPDAMTPEEGNDSLDTFVRQPIEKEPFLHSTRLGESPVQWIQLLLDQPDLPGWPLLAPVKVQMQKCAKCPREFCSPINYRRHIRVHRRSLNVNKEFYQNRDLLASFWDKLSLEEAKEVMSFNDVKLKEVPGSSVVKALETSLHRQAFWSLPQFYVNAGSTLLDIIQSNPSGFPVSSRDLFSLLDEASERTFLCAGTAESVQKYVFDGESATNSLELKNLVASTCFLFERQLVKAWIADKDEEALRCEKLLMEEEEAAKKRQAALIERKKQKKLRQKEHKVKVLGQRNLNLTVDALQDPSSAESSELSSSPDSNSSSLDVSTSPDSFPEPMQLDSKESERDIEAQLDLSDKVMNGNQQSLNNQWRVSRFHRGGRSHTPQNLQNLKPEHAQRPVSSRDRVLPNGGRVWAKKYNSHANTERLNAPEVQEETNHHTEENNCQVYIGTIPIILKDCVKDTSPDESNSTMVESNASEKVSRGDMVKSSANRKLWRPVSRGETKSNPTVDVVNGDVAGLKKMNGNVVPVFSNGNVAEKELPLDSVKEMEILDQKHKGSRYEDHVLLVISQEPNGCLDGNAEKQVDRSAKGKFRKKTEKSLKIQYIPKQKVAA